MKKCRGCGKIKTLGMFYRDKSMKDGLNTLCKECNKEKERSWRKRNLEKHCQRIQKWWKKNPERAKEIQKRTWEKQRYKQYGLTKKDFDKMVEEQDGRCAICGEKMLLRGKNGKILNIDHDHKTNIVRALLCRQCNQALGLFKDNPTLLLAAISYLQKYKNI